MQFWLLIIFYQAQKPFENIKITKVGFGEFKNLKAGQMSGFFIILATAQKKTNTNETSDFYFFVSVFFNQYESQKRPDKSFDYRWIQQS